MIARLLLFAATVAPLCDQDVDVSKYLEELRARVPALSPTDEAAKRQARQGKAHLYENIAGLDRQDGDVESAVAALRQARNLAPDDLSIAPWLADALVSGGRDAEAAELLGADPHDRAALVERASALSQSHRHLDLAMACAKLASKSQPEDLPILDLLAWISLESGRADYAIDLYLQLTQKAPEVARYHYRLALGFSSKGFTEYERDELRSNPSGAERAEIEKLLSSIPAQQ